MQIQSSTAPTFDFPEKVRNARRILIKPNVGYPAKPPAIVRMALLGQVIEQLLALRPDSHITVVEGVCSKVAAQRVFEATGLTQLARERVSIVDAEQLPQTPHPNTAANPFRFNSMMAPALLDEVDARISIAPFKVTQLNGVPLFSATIKNLYGLFPREKYHARSPHSRGQLHRPNIHQVICDCYHTLGIKFDYGIVDLHEKFISKDWRPDKGHAEPVGKIISGPSLLEVDLAACRAADETPCRYLEMLSL
jgi:uncharacterized protein (DUF362 family)